MMGILKRSGACVCFLVGLKEITEMYLLQKKIIIIIGI